MGSQSYPEPYCQLGGPEKRTYRRSGFHLSDDPTGRELSNLVARQSLSAAKPHKESAHDSGRNGECEKPPGFWQSYETHKKQTNYNHQSNWMASPKPRSVVAERNNLRGVRQVVRSLLNGPVMNIHGGYTLNNVYASDASLASDRKPHVR